MRAEALRKGRGGLSRLKIGNFTDGLATSFSVTFDQASQGKWFVSATIRQMNYLADP
jgi:hypothetical protein